MCFKKPKPPEKTEEQIQSEKELEELRKIRQAQLNKEISEQKDDRVEQEIARVAGMQGQRSLIKGGKGGAGFLGKYTRRAKPRGTGSGSRSRDSATPNRAVNPNTGSLFNYTFSPDVFSGGAGYIRDVNLV